MIKNRVFAIVKLLLMALSILLVCCILEPILSQFGPHYSLLSRRDFGKITFLIIVILHFGALIYLTSKDLFKDLIDRTLLFFVKDKWFLPFLKSFFLAVLTFTALFLVLLSLKKIQIVSPLPLFQRECAEDFIFGIMAAFTLAWSEELIFRGALYRYFTHHSFSPFWGALITSVVFSLSHNLTSPWSLVWPNWRLGLGLFLLGFLLNLIYIVSDKLYVNMGAHAGLVAAGRVVRRAFPFYVLALPLPWWLNEDLRSSFVVQALFLSLIVFLLFRFRPLIFKEVNKVN